MSGENESNDQKQGSDSVVGFKPISTQEEFDRAIGDRLTRERAKFEGFDEFKAKAEKFDQAAQATKTESQKQADALAALQKENEALKAAQLRATVARSKNVPEELLSGSTREQLEAAADKLLEFRGESGDEKNQRQPRLIVEGESGDSTNEGENSLRAVATQLFGPKN